MIARDVDVGQRPACIEEVGSAVRSIQKGQFVIGSFFGSDNTRQTLIVTSGTGWVQQWGGERREIRPGDVISIPPHVEHWLGGTATNRMGHIAITNVLDGKMVDRLEQVTDSQSMDSSRQ